MSSEHLGRRIVITGVSRGLGLALAEGFIAAGHVVYGCARSSGAIALLAKRFGSPHGFEVVDVACDDSVRRWSERVLAAGPPPDLIVNNAGLINRNAPLWKISAEEISQVIDVNINGVINVVRHFIPPLIRRRRGVIVNFT